jgi:hypothetical protein
MALFTIIMELDGGTYISQVRADDEWNALLNWPGQLKVEEIKGIGEKMRQRIIRELEQEPERNQPVLLSDSVNVWFARSMVWGKMLFINIIKTAED